MEVDRRQQQGGQNVEGTWLGTQEKLDKGKEEEAEKGRASGPLSRS